MQGRGHSGLQELQPTFFRIQLTDLLSLRLDAAGSCMLPVLLPACVMLFHMTVTGWLGMESAARKLLVAASSCFQLPAAAPTPGQPP